MFSPNICYNCTHNTLYHHCEIVQDKINEYEPNATFTGVEHFVFIETVEKHRDWRFLWLKKKDSIVNRRQQMVTFYLNAYGFSKEISVTRWGWMNMGAYDIYQFIFPHFLETYNQYKQGIYNGKFS